MKRLAALIAALVLVLMLPVAAVAAPPVNDLPAGATVLPGTVPQTFGASTTEATVTTADDVGCGAGGLDQATVWYRFTPAATGRVLIDASASGYAVGINVYLGAPTPDSLLNCFDPRGIFELEGGTAYTLMFADIDGNATNGGVLSVSISTAPPPIVVTVAVDSVAKRDQKGNTLIATGTIACSASAESAFVELVARQKVGKYVIRGFGFADTTCGPEPAEWSAEIFADNGRFGGGKATIDVLAAGCDPLQCGEFQQTFNVRLRR